MSSVLGWPGAILFVVGSYGKVLSDSERYETILMAGFLLLLAAAVLYWANDE